MTSPGKAARPRRARDPRVYQIASLAGLLAYGLAVLDFDVTPARAGLILATVLLTQLALGRAGGPGLRCPERADLRAVAVPAAAHELDGPGAGRPRCSPSPASSCCACRGKHVFNPTNFGIVACAAHRRRSGSRPGQWGNAAFFGVPDGLPGRAGREPRGAQRRHARLPRAYAGLLVRRARSGSASRWPSRSTSCRAARCCSSRSS